LFRADASEEAKEAAPAEIGRRFDHMERLLSDGRPFLLGEKFSVADAYLFVVSGWAEATGIGLARWPNLAAFVERVGARPSVKAAMAAEGLI
jgi:glutathione S-transferase